MLGKEINLGRREGVGEGKRREGRREGEGKREEGKGKARGNLKNRRVGKEIKLFAALYIP